MLLVYALATGDRVFIALQAYQLLALGSIYLLSRRHKGRPCADHCGTPAQPAAPGADAQRLRAGTL
jgi:hypothetical protein